MEEDYKSFGHVSLQKAYYISVNQEADDMLDPKIRLVQEKICCLACFSQMKRLNLANANAS